MFWGSRIGNRVTSSLRCSSRPWSAMFARRGEITPPCGVPAVGEVVVPSWRIFALSHALICLSIMGKVWHFFRSCSWPILSKQERISASSTYFSALLMPWTVAVSNYKAFSFETESVAVCFEFCFSLRFQGHFRQSLSRSVDHGWDAEGSRFPGLLGYVRPAYFVRLGSNPYIVTICQFDSLGWGKGTYSVHAGRIFSLVVLGDLPHGQQFGRQRDAGASGSCRDPF